MLPGAIESRRPTAAAPQKAHCRHLHRPQWSFARSALQKPAHISTLESPVRPVLQLFGGSGGGGGHAEAPTPMQNGQEAHLQKGQCALAFDAVQNGEQCLKL